MICLYVTLVAFLSVLLLEMMVLFLQISGEIPAVLRAVVEIGCQLRWTSVVYFNMCSLYYYIRDPVFKC